MSHDKAILAFFQQACHADLVAEDREVLCLQASSRPELNLSINMYLISIATKNCNN
jgi:hypothetical protein